MKNVADPPVPVKPATGNAIMSKQTETDPPRTFAGFHGPNFTQVPDQLFDELLPTLSGSELKVLLYIIRRTFGFKRDADAISLSQMLSGIVTRDGRRLDHGAGVSKKSLLSALRSLEKRSIIVIERRRIAGRGDTASVYQLNVIRSETRGVKTPPRGGAEFPHGGGGEIPPGPRGKNSPTQDTGLQETEEQETDIKNIEYSNIRKVSTLDGEGAQDQPSSPATAETSTEGGPETVGEVLARRAGGASRSKPRPETLDEDYQRIQAYIVDRAREFNDSAPLKSSTTRAWNLYQRSGLSIEAFTERIFQARALTQEGSGRITKVDGGSEYGPKQKMPYFFAVLEDQLGLADPKKKRRRSAPSTSSSRKGRDDYRGIIQS
jgi:hypothetical protein